SFFQAEDFSRRSHLDMLSPLDATRMSAYEVVIHLAAHLSKNPADAEECFRANVEGTVNLLREMEPNSVFIFASTKDIYGAHVEDFARACQSFIDSSVTHGLYNLGGGRANSLSLRDIIDKVAEMIQCNPVLDEANPLPAPVPLHYVSNLNHIREELGWEPQIG